MLRNQVPGPPRPVHINLLLEASGGRPLESRFPVLLGVWQLPAKLQSGQMIFQKYKLPGIQNILTEARE